MFMSEFVLKICQLITELHLPKMKNLLFSLCFVSLCGCGTAVPFVKNMPNDDLSIIYLHQHCSGKSLRGYGPRVQLNGKYKGKLVENGYMEFWVPAGTHRLNVKWSGYEDAEIEVDLKQQETVFVQYNYFEESTSKPEILNLVNAFKKSKPNEASLDLYPEDYALSTMGACLKIESKI